VYDRIFERFCGKNKSVTLLEIGVQNGGNHWNILLAWFSERYLKKLLQENGFIEITRMDNAECRGHDYGFINLGIKALKANNVLFGGRNDVS
jgi:hypothetical protein